MITEYNVMQTLKNRRNIMISERVADEILEKLEDHLSETIAITGRSYESGVKVTVLMPMSDFVDIARYY